MKVRVASLKVMQKSQPVARTEPPARTHEPFHFFYLAQGRDESSEPLPSLSSSTTRSSSLDLMTPLRSNTVVQHMEQQQEQNALQSLAGVKASADAGLREFIQELHFINQKATVLMSLGAHPLANPRGYGVCRGFIVCMDELQDGVGCALCGMVIPIDQADAHSRRCDAGRRIMSPPGSRITSPRSANCSPVGSPRGPGSPLITPRIDSRAAGWEVYLLVHYEVGNRWKPLFQQPWASTPSSEDGRVEPIPLLPPLPAQAWYSRRMRQLDTISRAFLDLPVEEMTTDAPQRLIRRTQRLRNNGPPLERLLAIKLLFLISIVSRLRQYQEATQFTAADNAQESPQSRSYKNPMNDIVARTAAVHFERRMSERKVSSPMLSQSMIEPHTISSQHGAAQEAQASRAFSRRSSRRLCRICEELVDPKLWSDHIKFCAIRGKVDISVVEVNHELDTLIKELDNCAETPPSLRMDLCSVLRRALMTDVDVEAGPNPLQRLIRQLETMPYDQGYHRLNSLLAKALTLLRRKASLLNDSVRAMLQSPRLDLFQDPANGRTQSPQKSRLLVPTIHDFDFIKPLARGGYGTVFLARKKKTGDLYAIKVLSIQHIVQKQAASYVMAERNILASVESRWVVKMAFAMRSKNYLYLVMEYMPGGDLYSLAKEVGYLDEDHARFYIAEAVLAIADVHKTGIIHRDIKPDNLLIDANGHVKLTDFGLSKFGLINKLSSHHRPTNGPSDLLVDPGLANEPKPKAVHRPATVFPRHAPKRSLSPPPIRMSPSPVHHVPHGRLLGPVVKLPNPSSLIVSPKLSPLQSPKQSPKHSPKQSPKQSPKPASDPCLQPSPQPSAQPSPQQDRAVPSPSGGRGGTPLRRPGHQISSPVLPRLALPVEGGGGEGGGDGSAPPRKAIRRKKSRSMIAPKKLKPTTKSQPGDRDNDDATEQTVMRSLRAFLSRAPGLASFLHVGAAQGSKSSRSTPNRHHALSRATSASTLPAIRSAGPSSVDVSEDSEGRHGEDGGGCVGSPARDSANHADLSAAGDYGAFVRARMHSGRSAARSRASIVGTPHYLDPNILLGLGHGQGADWWALGITLFELLNGYPPFNGATVESLFATIQSGEINWPEEDELSAEAKDLIIKLLQPEPSERLGANGAEEVMAHPWFSSVDWDSLPEQEPPFVPKDVLESELDTEYFECRMMEDFEESDADKAFLQDPSLSRATSPVLGRAEEPLGSFWHINVAHLATKAEEPSLNSDEATDARDHVSLSADFSHHSYSDSHESSGDDDDDGNGSRGMAISPTFRRYRSSSRSSHLFDSSLSSESSLLREENLPSVVMQAAERKRSLSDRSFSSSSPLGGVTLPDALQVVGCDDGHGELVDNEYADDAHVDASPPLSSPPRAGSKQSRPLLRRHEEAVHMASFLLSHSPNPNRKKGAAPSADGASAKKLKESPP